MRWRESFRLFMATECGFEPDESAVRFVLTEKHISTTKSYDVECNKLAEWMISIVNKNKDITGTVKELLKKKD
jgi:hypothetical protein